MLREFVGNERGCLGKEEWGGVWAKNAFVAKSEFVLGKEKCIIVAA